MMSPQMKPDQPSVAPAQTGPSGATTERRPDSLALLGPMAVLLALDVFASAFRFPTWDALPTLLRFVLVCATLLVAAQIIRTVRWLIQCRADRRAGGRVSRAYTTTVALMPVLSVALVGTAWTHWPFDWWMRGCLGTATELVTKAPDVRYGGAVGLGSGTYAVYFLTDAGPLFCTEWSGKHLVGILRHPGGAVPRNLRLLYPPPGDGTWKRLRIFTCYPLSAEWHTVTWELGEDSCEPPPTAAMAPADAEQHTIQPAGDPLPGSMKGYDLYAWNDGSQTWFTLLPGTNREKTPHEVFAGARDEISDAGNFAVTVAGLEAVGGQLARVARGEYVAVHTVRYPPGAALEVVATPECLKRRLQQDAATLGLNLDVVPW